MHEVNQRRFVLVASDHPIVSAVRARTLRRPLVPTHRDLRFHISRFADLRERREASGMFANLTQLSRFLSIHLALICHTVSPSQMGEISMMP